MQNARGETQSTHATCTHWALCVTQDWVLIPGINYCDMKMVNTESPFCPKHVQSINFWHDTYSCWSCLCSGWVMLQFTESYWTPYQAVDPYRWDLSVIINDTLPKHCVCEGAELNVPSWACLLWTGNATRHGNYLLLFGVMAHLQFRFHHSVTSSSRKLFSAN